MAEASSEKPAEAGDAEEWCISVTIDMSGLKVVIAPTYHKSNLK